VERPRRKVRFARLIQRRGRDLGGPTVRAACGGNLSLTWLPLGVVPQYQIGERLSEAAEQWATLLATCAKFAIDPSVGECLHALACHLVLWRSGSGGGQGDARR
jgi:hypothetical protein